MTIDLEKLRAVKTIIAHGYRDRPCADGVASALVLRDVLPNAEIRFVSYGEELAELEAEPGMLFCDIAPTPERAPDFIAQGSIVLDHHASARTVVELFTGLNLGAYGDAQTMPGVSGAWLAYAEVWVRLAYQGTQRPRYHTVEGRGSAGVRKLARLAGVRDTWQRASEEWVAACEQSEALEFWPWKSWPAFPFGVNGHNPDFLAMMAIGPVLYAKKQERAVKTAKEAFITHTLVGTSLAIIPTLSTSDVAEVLDQEVDIVIGFAYKPPTSANVFNSTPTLVLSLRSHKGFDVSMFCKAHGGGGHRAAAGCEIHPSMWSGEQPYSHIVRLIEAWENHRADAIIAP